MKSPSRLQRALLALLLIALASGVALYAWLIPGLPSLDGLQARLNIPSVRIVDRQGRMLYESVATDGGRHAVVPLSEIPLALRQATIATEDNSFYSNPGVDLSGILRAVWINLRRGETLAGGSTITQQVARNLLLDSGERGQRRLRRKLREALLAWQLSRRVPKDEILALYLNQTYYGGLAYGVEAAAQTYFDKPVSQLDLAEAAMLAGLPQAPALYNPFTDLEAARARQSVVLRLMERSGAITAEQRQLAEREPLIFSSTPYPIQAPHFIMQVRAAVDRLFTPDEILQHGGLEVRTTLDLDWQHLAERAVARQIEAMQHSEDGLGHNLNNAALVALDTHSGEILALVGSPDYFDAEHGGAINMAVAPRQPGSALKPLVYALAMDPSRPAPWTPATMLLDVSTSFLTHDGQSYTPANYDRREHGPVLVREALGSSLNIPAVLTLDHVGLKELFEFAGKLGITTFHDPERYDLSLALGGGEVRLTELAAAYGTFANGGYRVNPSSILEISDFQGNTLYTAPAVKQARVIDPRLAWLISDILSDDNARRLGFGPHTILNLDRTAAVKTGTTSNFHDNWTVGYTPDLVVGVWAGNTSYEPMREVNGLTGAAPIWHEFMRSVLTGKPEQSFPRPDGLQQFEVCDLSGLLPTPACPYRKTEWFISGTQPTRPDLFYRTLTVDRLTGGAASAGTPPERRDVRTFLDLPQPAWPWARAQGLTLLSDLATSPALTQQAGSPPSVPADSPSSSGAASTPLVLVSPAPGSLFRLAPGFDAAAQRVRLQALGQLDLRNVTLWVDGAQVAGEAASPFTAWWPLAAGRHQAWAEGELEDGHPVVSERVNFEVR